MGIWDRAEYENLCAQDRNELGGRVFGCHLADGSLCRGWLADQKRRGVPSIQLRLQLMMNEQARTEYEAVDDSDSDLYESIEEMCQANEGRAFPNRSKKARKLAAMKDPRRSRTSKGKEKQ